MSQQSEKYKGKSLKYKGVYSSINRNGKLVYFYNFKYKGINYKGTYDTEYEATKQYDIKLIENGKKPVNLLKPK